MNSFQCDDDLDYPVILSLTDAEPCYLHEPTAAAEPCYLHEPTAEPCYLNEPTGAAGPCYLHEPTGSAEPCYLQEPAAAAAETDNLHQLTASAEPGFPLQTACNEVRFWKFYLAKRWIFSWYPCHIQGVPKKTIPMF